MRALSSIVAAGIVAVLSASAFAQDDYPTRPVRFVVGYPPGGQSDVLGRIVARGLTQELGKQVIVENMGGAGGTIAASSVAKATPDGYTLVLSVEATQSRAKVFFPRTPYDQIKSFTFLRKMATQRALLVVNADSDIRSVSDLIAYAKANPKKLNYGGVRGAATHIGGSIFDKLNGTEMTFVNYAGGNQQIVDLLAGVTQLGFFIESTVAEHVKAGKLRALAVVSSEKSVTFPDLPTMQEAGAKPMDVSTWFGVVGPAGLPPAVASRLMQALDRWAADPEFEKDLKTIGAIPIKGSNPANFVEETQREIAFWSEWAKDHKVE